MCVYESMRGRSEKEKREIARDTMEHVQSHYQYLGTDIHREMLEQRYP